MCCNNEASVVLSGSGEAQLGPEIVLSASTPPGGLALEWQRAVARSGNIIAGLRSALTWTCLVFFSRVCGVRVVCCGVAVDVVCSSRVPASLDAVPPRRVVIAAEWHMKLAIAASEHAPEPALRALFN